MDETRGTRLIMVVVRRDQVGRDDQDKVNASSDMAGYVYCIWTVAAPATVLSVICP
jgi:hypothetical protein